MDTKSLYNISSAGSNKSGKQQNANAAASLAEMQRAFELQKQYLEMLSQNQMPNQRHSSGNWKNN